VYSKQVPHPQQQRRPGERAGLTTEAVVGTARRLIHRDGSDALSMRRIAAELGVLPNALYSHVADKQALEDLLVDQLLGEIRWPTEGTWRERTLAVHRETRATLLSEPAIATVYVQRAGRGPNALRLAQRSLQMLDEIGLTGERAAQVFRVLIAHTVGFVAFELSRTHSDRAAAAALPPGTGLDGLAQSPGELEYALGLEWLIDGVLAWAKPQRARKASTG
jgi:TetR/AcrR family tetracycline transcriptional repressor